MNSPLALIPATGDGDSILFGTCSGAPVLLRHSSIRPDWKVLNVFSTCCGHCCLKDEVERCLRNEYGPRERISHSTDSKLQLPNDLPDPGKLSLVLDAANVIGWERVACLSGDCRHIEFAINDRRYRCHSLKFTIDSTGIKCDVALPEKFLAEDSTIDLVSVYERFIDAIDEHQLFWDDLKELDDSACIMEPVRPSFSDLFRVVYLEPHVSLQITVDPTSPRAVPKFTLLGPEIKIRSYQRLMDNHLSSWDDEVSLMTNLLRMFGTFKKPGDFFEQSQKRRHSSDEYNRIDEDGIARCEICYGVDEPPQQTCTKCHRLYHQSCLLQATRRQKCTFGALVCRCPQCGQAISMKGSGFR